MVAVVLVMVFVVLSVVVAARGAWSSDWPVIKKLEVWRLWPFPVCLHSSALGGSIGNALLVDSL